ncbi:MAG TPA: GTPase Era [Clostridiales bacterium]|nr:GTPase Era [Clostridiales bacterium]HPZ05127.1 GTPase Era [Clostridiales bacterium]HQD30715.1 GTPase Era [Clostridiales bacterium]
MFKSGFVSIIGRPNVGKSTLSNNLIGEKLSIISSKPQTTRNAIKAIINTDNSQIVLIDTPGIHKPKNKLGEYMVKLAESTLNEVDIILFMVEATDGSPGAGDLYIAEQLKSVKTPVILIINKIDLVKKDRLLETIKNFSELMDFKAVIPVSAINADGTDLVVNEIRKLLPEGPKYFPDDMITDQPERMLAAELIREKMLELLQDEVPHGTGVEIITFKEREGKDLIDIEANIYCERETHKGIIIGKQGAMLKNIGSLARNEMENLFGIQVFLKLWVKVRPGWRNSSNILRTLGYQ